MEADLYKMIFKRKSFHLFRDIGRITPEEVAFIQTKFKTFAPLVEDIETDIRIVPADTTSCKRGQEYCILLYSERKGNYLQNIGYIGEQLDLYLASLGIGALWFGIGKTDEGTHNGLDFVIMIAIAKMEDEKFRKDMFRSKRKNLDDIWIGKHYRELGNIVRFAPSACNTQPWKVIATQHELSVFRYKKPGKRGMMPVDKVAYYNRIDVGIFLCFLELCLKQNGICFTRELFPDNAENTGTTNNKEQEEILFAKYTLA